MNRPPLCPPLRGQTCSLRQEPTRLRSGCARALIIHLTLVFARALDRGAAALYKDGGRTPSRLPTRHPKSCRRLIFGTGMMPSSAHCDAFEIGDESALSAKSTAQKQKLRPSLKLHSQDHRSEIFATRSLGLVLERHATFSDHDASQSIDKLVSLTDYSTFKEVAGAEGARGRALAEQVGVDVSAGEDVQVAAEGLIPSWDDALASLQLIEPPSAANGWVRTLELPELISERKVTAEARCSCA